MILYKTPDKNHNGKLGLSASQYLKMLGENHNRNKRRLNRVGSLIRKRSCTL